MDEKALHRLNILGRHVAPTSSSSAAAEDSLALQGTSGANMNPLSGQNGARSSYASVTGQPSSYARVHGEVSKTPVKWRSIPSVSKETLKEVKYEKSVGEGIAKVRYFSFLHIVWGETLSTSSLHRLLKINKFYLADYYQPPRETQCLHPTHRSRALPVLCRCSR